MSFSRSYGLKRHQEQSCVERWVVADTIAAKRRRLDGASTSGLNHVPSPITLHCDVCNVDVPQNHMPAHTRTLAHRRKCRVPLSPGVQIVESAFKNRIVSYHISSERDHVDYQAFFEDIRTKVLNLLEDILRTQKSLKVNMVAVGRYFLPTQEIFSEKSFNTSNRIVTLGCDLNELYDRFAEEMKVQAADFQEKDSGMFKNEFHKLYEMKVLQRYWK